MKTETILLLGVAGVAVWYFLIRKPDAPAAPAPAPVTNITQNQAKRTNWQDVAIAGIQTGGNIASKFVPGA
jgi:hypothetical protein